MNRRDLLVQGALAFAGLTAAYFTWQRSPELGDGAIVVLDVTTTDLQKVRFTDDESKSWVELTRGKDAEGAFAWLRMSGFDASGVAMPAGHPGIEIKRPEREVRGNANGQRLLDKFAPLVATRSLGTLEASQLKDFGFETSKKHIDVTWRGGTKRFTIVPAPPGGSDPYLKDEKDGRVYIVTRQILSDFQSASTNLVEKQLHAFFLEDVNKLTVSTVPAGQKREFLATRNENQMPGIRLAPADKPSEPDATARNWHDRIWNLFPAEVLGKDELPNGVAPVVALRIDYVSRGRPPAFLELAHPGKPTSGATPPSVVYARTERTAGWVSLSGEASSLIDEGTALVTRK